MPASDPPHLPLVARELAKLVARGLISPDAARHVIACWTPNAPDLRIRLCWTLEDEAQALRRGWDRAARRIRRAVRPLMRAHRPAAEIEEVAGNAAGNVLDWPDIAAVLADEAQSISGR